jgi:flagellar biosynthesis GTPase FlhF
MLIKNFQAGTVQDALDLVRREFGQSAVILKTDIVKDAGKRVFCVTAAKDYQASEATSPKIAKPMAVPALELSGNGTQSPAANTRLEAAILDVMLPELLSGEIKRYYLALRANEVESDLALHICSQLQRSEKATREELARIIEDILAKGTTFPDKEKDIVFVGPCGSGKSSLLAKCAADLVFNRHKAVSLSTLDNFRPGAEVEINNLSEILGFVQETTGEKAHKSAARSYHLVDTCGLVPGDAESLAALQGALAEIPDRFTILVLSLATSWKNNRRFLAYCLPLGIGAIALTQLDAAGSVGTILNIAAHEYPPIVGVSDSRLPTGAITAFDLRQHLDKLIGEEDA